jgi:hypothetical protein
MLDRLRSERGEKRLIDGAGAPRAEDRRDQFGRTRQHASHHVAGLHALLDQQVRDARRQREHLRERIAAVSAAGIDPVERNGVGVGRGMAVATFDAGVQALLEVAVQLRGGRLDTEAGNGVGVGRRRPAVAPLRMLVSCFVMTVGEPRLCR